MLLNPLLCIDILPGYVVSHGPELLAWPLLVDVLIVVFEFTKRPLLVSCIRDGRRVFLVVLVVIVFFTVVFVVIRPICDEDAK